MKFVVRRHFHQSCTIAILQPLYFPATFPFTSKRLRFFFLLLVLVLVLVLVTTLILLLHSLLLFRLFFNASRPFSVGGHAV